MNNEAKLHSNSKGNFKMPLSCRYCVRLYAQKQRRWASNFTLL